MNKIDKVFEKLNSSKNKAIIPYLTGGDPDIDRTLKLMQFYAENGADIIEIGVPFSDPMADGPVIQAAMERALKAGTTLKSILNLVKRFRRNYDTPLVLMGYMNPFYAYGLERFCKDAKEAGVDGILTVDMPPEEAEEFVSYQRKYDLTPVFLVTPVTNEDRILKIKKYATSFVYFVSVTGVTGERVSLPADTEKKLIEIKKLINMPTVIGFGISSPEIIISFYDIADGFVIGSALVKRAERIWSSTENARDFENFFKSLAFACHKGRIA